MLQQQFINNILFVVVYLFIMFLVSWKLTLVALILFPALLYAINMVIGRINMTAVASVEYEKRLSREISNALSCIPLVKFYSQEASEAKRFSVTSAIIKELEFSMDTKQSVIMPLQEIFVLTAVLLLASMMAYMATSAKSAEVPALLVYLYLLKKCSGSFNQVNSARSSLAMAHGQIKEVQNILDDKDKYFVPDGHIAYGGLKEQIQFKNLSFSYKKGIETLKSITFSVEKGKMVAIVGPTGAGKTTIINLLQRFYDCPSSSMFIDGTDVRDFTMHTLRARMATVSQDTLLFDDTIRNNILYGGDQTISDDRLAEVLKKARLDILISNLPDGVNTYIGDRGVQLSGGEKQRVSIARALLREPEILILDEATSALDTKTEKLIQAAINEIVRDKTTIVIAHRLSTIQNADKIVAIEEGRIVEEGGFKELLARKGKFYQYWEEQKFY